MAMNKAELFEATDWAYDLGFFVRGSLDKRICDGPFKLQIELK